MENSPCLRRGFSIIELLVVMVCIATLLIPIWTIYRSGQRTSLQGMSQIDTSLEARRILKQIRRDLKQSCYILYKLSPRIDFKFMLTVEPLTPPHRSFSFLVFPGSGDLSEAIASLGDPLATGKAVRRLSRITYALEPSGDPEKPLLQLVREERFHPATAVAATLPNGIRRHVLSTRLNYFSIEPHVVQSGGEKRFFFWVALQTVDSARPKNLPFTVGTKLTARIPGIAISDFFDVVPSEFFHSVWNQEGMRRNWHTFLEAP